jgi:hypothetical protein
MEVTCFSEMLVDFQQTTLRYIPELWISCCLEYFKYIQVSKIKNIESQKWRDGGKKQITEKNVRLLLRVLENIEPRNK